jgi:hypothetical protein
MKCCPHCWRLTYLDVTNVASLSVRDIEALTHGKYVASMGFTVRSIRYVARVSSSPSILDGQSSSSSSSESSIILTDVNDHNNNGNNKIPNKDEIVDLDFKIWEYASPEKFAALRDGYYLGDDRFVDISFTSHLIVFLAFEQVLTQFYWSVMSVLVCLIRCVARYHQSRCINDHCVR